MMNKIWSLPSRQARLLDKSTKQWLGQHMISGKWGTWNLSEEGERSFWPGVVLQGLWDVENVLVLWECWFEITGGEQPREQREAGKGCAASPQGEGSASVLHAKQGTRQASDLLLNIEGRWIDRWGSGNTRKEKCRAHLYPRYSTVGLALWLQREPWRLGGSSQETALQQEGRIMGWKEPLNSVPLRVLTFQGRYLS